MMKSKLLHRFASRLTSLVEDRRPGPPRNWVRGMWVVVVTACWMAAVPGSGGAAEPAEIVKVEEDWVVQIGVPDPNGHAPQIINAMSSTHQLADVHAVFELNHKTLPEYSAGNKQLQIWSGDVNLDYRTGPKHGILSTENEEIRYTMSMMLTGGSLRFEVVNGSSTTWGSFGGEGYLRCTVSTPQSDLSLYDPAVSVANSRIEFARHRVKKFALKEVRYYTADSDEPVEIETEERVVHVHNPD